MPSSIRSAVRVFRIFLVLMIAVAVVWITNSVGSTVQSALPYVLAALLAWEFTRVLTVRRLRGSPKPPQKPKPQLDYQEHTT